MDTQVKGAHFCCIPCIYFIEFVEGIYVCIHDDYSVSSVFFQDIARLTLIALRNEKIGKTLLTFAGPRAWTTQEVIKDFRHLSASFQQNIA